MRETNLRLEIEDYHQELSGNARETVDLPLVVHLLGLPLVGLETVLPIALGKPGMIKA
jgi:hypothetical protein